MCRQGPAMTGISTYLNLQQYELWNLEEKIHLCEYDFSENRLSLAGEGSNPDNKKQSGGSAG